MCFKTKGLYKCGKCPECLAERQVSWSLRLIEYAKTHSCFSCLLTYDPKFVPMTKDGLMTLSKKDIQKFIKRLRHVFSDCDIKYYIAGEYSPEKFRPHYHCLIFNLPKVLSQKKAIALLEKTWQNGFVGNYSNWLKSNAQINYALGYYIYLYDWKNEDSRVKPFSLISKGLAMEWHGDQFNKILDDLYNKLQFFADDLIVDKSKIGYASRYIQPNGCPVWLDRRSRDVYEPFYYDFEEHQLKVVPELHFLLDFYKIVLPQSKFNRSTNQTIDCKPKSFMLPRVWREKIFSKDVQRVINTILEYEAKLKDLKYQEIYGEYDKTTDFPMWKQLKYYRYKQKKKNKKNKLLSDPLSYFE